MQTIGILGWRGLVGNELLKLIPKDFYAAKPIFFERKDTQNINLLKKCNIIVTCCGSTYTKEMHTKLRKENWDGYWIDSSSYLRLLNSSCLILDPINAKQIEDAIKNGVKDFIGANCTVSLMLMAIGNLMKFIKWINVSTYQSISGAGSKAMDEFLDEAKNLKQNGYFSNVIPQIGSVLDDNFTEEENKGLYETNKICESNILIDSTCVRISSLRCHSQSITLELKEDISIDKIKEIIKNPWLEIINDSEIKEKLTPFYVEKTPKIVVGRIRKLRRGNNFISLFTIGDQLVWGAALPISRMIKKLVIGSFG